MEVYLLKADVDHYKGFEMCDPSDLRVAYRFVGQSLEREWRPLRVRPIEDEMNDGLPIGDFPYITSFPILSRPARTCLEEVLRADAEFLPLTWGDQELYAMNVITVLDGLDETRSQIDYLPSGPVVSIKKHVFIPDAIRGHRVFKIRQDKVVDVFVTEEVLERVRACGLLGAKFNHVWSRPTL